MDMSSFCSQAAGILQFVGWIVTIIKVFMPILIIIFGVLDFGKAVVGSDEKVIQKSAKSLGMRVVAGLVIFSIPSIIMWLFGLIDAYNNASQEFNVCKTCILAPWNCKVTVSGNAY